MYDRGRGLVLYSNVTDRVVEMAKFEHREVDGENEQIIVMSFMHLLPEA